MYPIDLGMSPLDLVSTLHVAKPCSSKGMAMLFLEWIATETPERLVAACRHGTC